MKQGYKQTEIGVIPEDWECVSLNNVCTFIGGGTPSKNVPQFWNGNIPWISSSDIIGGDIYNININRHITEKAIKLSAIHKCPKNTILVVSRVGVGKVAISDCEVCTSQDFTNLIPKLHDPLFLTIGTRHKIISPDCFWWEHHGHAHAILSTFLVLASLKVCDDEI